MAPRRRNGIRRERATFVDFELSARGFTAKVRKAAEREWASKTGEQKDAILEAINEAQNSLKPVVLWRGYAEAATENVDDALALGPQYTEQLWSSASAALAEYQRYRRYLRQSSLCWRALARVYIAQDGHDHTLAYIQVQRRTAQDMIRNEVKVARDRLQGFLNRPPVPAGQDGAEKVPWNWVDNDQRAATANKLIEGVQDDDVDVDDEDDGRWLARPTLGGGLSLTHLWLRVDDNYRITDRVVRKDTYMTEARWWDPREFEGDVTNDAVKVPWEVATHTAMEAVPDANNIAELRRPFNRNLDMHSDLTMYHLYLRWCPHGDLSLLIKRYVMYQGTVPEPFCWYVFQALAECGLAMEKGGVDHRAKDWDEIVHRDLKPSNIFLDKPSKDRYEDYPTPRLGDFGLAFRTPPKDPRNPRWWNLGGGTPGYIAPEMTKCMTGIR